MRYGNDCISFRNRVGKDQYDKLLRAPTFEAILDHTPQEDPRNNDHEHEGNEYDAKIEWNVKIEWNGGEVTHEPLANIATDGPPYYATQPRDMRDGRHVEDDFSDAVETEPARHPKTDTKADAGNHSVASTPLAWHPKKKTDVEIQTSVNAYPVKHDKDHQAAYSLHYLRIAHRQNEPRQQTQNSVEQRHNDIKSHTNALMKGRYNFEPKLKNADPPDPHQPVLTIDGEHTGIEDDGPPLKTEDPGHDKNDSTSIPRELKLTLSDVTGWILHEEPISFEADIVEAFSNRTPKVNLPGDPIRICTMAPDFSESPEQSFNIKQHGRHVVETFQGTIKKELEFNFKPKRTTAGETTSHGHEPTTTSVPLVITFLQERTWGNRPWDTMRVVKFV